MWTISTLRSDSYQTEETHKLKPHNNSIRISFHEGPCIMFFSIPTTRSIYFHSSRLRFHSRHAQFICSGSPAMRHRADPSPRPCAMMYLSFCTHSSSSSKVVEGSGEEARTTSKETMSTVVHRPIFIPRHCYEFFFECRTLNYPWFHRRAKFGCVLNKFHAASGRQSFAKGGQ